MSNILQIYDNSLALKAIIKTVLKDNLTEELLGLFEYTFTSPVNEKILEYLEDGNIVKVEDDYFDIVKYELKSDADNIDIATVETEHVSYRLSNQIIEDGGYSHFGDLQSHLNLLLSGTDFMVGTIQTSDDITYTVTEKKSIRAIIYELFLLAGQEISFSGFTINSYYLRGDQNGKLFTKNRNIKIIGKTFDKKTEDGIPIISYFCTPINMQDRISLGDKAVVIHKDLDINVDMRIVSISRSICDPINVEIELSNKSVKLEDSIYKIVSEKLQKQNRYYGITLGPDDGLKMEASDLSSRMLLNSDELRMQKGDGVGNYEDKLYFDTILGEFVFNGTIYAEDGQFSGDIVAATVTGGTISAADISGSTITGGTITGTVIDNGTGTFYVDSLGNLEATSVEISGIITGSSFNTLKSGDVNYAEIDDDGIHLYTYFGGAWLEHGMQNDYTLGGTTWKNAGNPWFNLHAEGTSGGMITSFDSSSNLYNNLLVDSGYSYPFNVWDFSTHAIAVYGLETGYSGTHNHGIPNGTKLATSSDGVNVDGNVTWVESGSHMHGVRKA